VLKAGLGNAELVTIEGLVKNSINEVFIMPPIGSSFKAQIRIVWTQAWKWIDFKDVGIIMIIDIKLKVYPGYIVAAHYSEGSCSQPL